MKRNRETIVSLVVRAPFTREAHEIEHLISSLLLESEHLRRFEIEVREVSVGKFTAGEEGDEEDAE